MSPSRTAFFLHAAIAVLFSGMAGAADIGLAPPRLELVVPPGGSVTETVSLATTGIEVQQVRVSKADWILDPRGQVIYFPEGSLPVSAAAWIEPETTDLLLEPRTVREFRLTVNVPADPSLAGTYHAMLFFEVVPPANEDDGIGVVTTTRIALAVYVTVAGTEDDAVELIDFFDEDGTLTLALANHGNTVVRLGGFIELRNENGEQVERLAVPDVPVLRESERELRLSLPEELPPGFYVALALIEPSRGGLLAGELPLTVE